MMNVQPVQIVRPRQTLSEITYRMAADIIVLAINAWAVMVLLPVVVPSLHLSYWHTVAAFILIRMVIHQSWNPDRWSVLAEKRDKA